MTTTSSDVARRRAEGPAWGIGIFIAIALLTAGVIGATVHANDAEAKAALTASTGAGTTALNP